MKYWRWWILEYRRWWQRNTEGDKYWKTGSEGILGYRRRGLKCGLKWLKIRMILVMYYIKYYNNGNIKSWYSPKLVEDWKYYFLSQTSSFRFIPYIANILVLTNTINPRLQPHGDLVGCLAYPLGNYSYSYNIYQKKL